MSVFTDFKDSSNQIAECRKEQLRGEFIHWKEFEPGQWFCPICNYLSHTDRFRHCPHCGQLMYSAAEWEQALDSWVKQDREDH